MRPSSKRQALRLAPFEKQFAVIHAGERLARRSRSTRPRSMPVRSKNSSSVRARSVIAELLGAARQYGRTTRPAKADAAIGERGWRCRPACARRGRWCGGMPQWVGRFVRRDAPGDGVGSPLVLPPPGGMRQASRTGGRHEADGRYEGSALRSETGRALVQAEVGSGSGRGGKSHGLERRDRDRRRRLPGACRSLSSRSRRRRRRSRHDRAAACPGSSACRPRPRRCASTSTRFHNELLVIITADHALRAGAAALRHRALQRQAPSGAVQDDAQPADRGDVDGGAGADPGHHRDPVLQADVLHGPGAARRHDAQGDRAPMVLDLRVSRSGRLQLRQQHPVRRRRG